MGPNQIYSGVASVLPCVDIPAQRSQTSQGHPYRSSSPSFETGRSIAEICVPSMSALGHKQTRAAQRAMSAVPPIATAKADARKKACRLYPRKQACAVQLGMSALGQKRTHAVQHLGCYSITSSVRASSVGGTIMPRDFAVCRLITSSNVDNCNTGRSEALAPLRICPV